MKTKTIKLYEFKELSDKAKNKVLKEASQINFYNDWADSIIDQFKQDMGEIGLSNVEVFWNGFGSQGDGACFTANVNIAAFLKGRDSRFPMIMEQSDEFDFRIKHSGTYNHAITMYGDWHDFPRLEGENMIKLDREMGAFEEFAVAELRDEAKKLYRELSEQNDFLSSDEAIIEAIESNEYMFREDGTLENE